MEDKRDQQGQQDSGFSERKPDKNETIDNAGANVIDYGRSEQKAVENSKQDPDKSSDSDVDNDRKK